MKNIDDLKKNLLQDGAFKKAYDSLESEYELSRSIIQARQSKSMTQAQLAEKVGVKREMIARLESGTSNPTVGTVQRVARALGKELKLVTSK
jgi:DNA-binding XRE family transcriptional regulator